MRPSQLLKGDLWEYQIDLLLGSEAMRDSSADLKSFIQKHGGLAGGIAAAAHVAYKATP